MVQLILCLVGGEPEPRDENSVKYRFESELMSADTLREGQVSTVRQTTQFAEKKHDGGVGKVNSAVVAASAATVAE
jgi:hypothetical protein